MYNSPIPHQAELPSSQQLLRSTGIAAISAAVLLATVVLPSEYGLDPTGVGRVLGFTEMGEIKTRLAQEAAEEAAASRAGAQQTGSLPATTPPVAATTPAMPATTPPVAVAAAAVTPTAPAAAPVTPAVAPVPAAAPMPAAAPVAEAQSMPSAEPLQKATPWRDEITFSLKPGQGSEVKMKMKDGEKAIFSWGVQGGVVNFDTHGDGSGRSISYEKGRSVASDDGELVAAFTGNHGWFWRNRGAADVTLTIKAAGDYSDIQRVK